MSINSPQLWPYLTPEDHDLNNIKSSLPVDVSTFLRIRFLKNCINLLPLWPHLTPGDHDLNRSKSTLPEDAYTQVFEKIFLFIPM